jgi:hypothetical protein
LHTQHQHPEIQFRWMLMLPDVLQKHSRPASDAESWVTWCLTAYKVWMSEA